MVCGFCSSGCCTTSCCGGGCAHAQNTTVIITIVITDNSFFLIKPPIQFLKLAASDLARRICASVSMSFLVSGWPSAIGTNSDPKPETYSRHLSLDPRPSTLLSAPTSGTLRDTRRTHRQSHHPPNFFRHHHRNHRNSHGPNHHRNRIHHRRQSSHCFSHHYQSH